MNAVKLILVLAIFAAGFAAGKHWEHGAVLEIQAQVAADDAARAAALAAQEKANRAEEARRTAAQKEIERHAQVQIDAARADAVRADRAAASLHDQLEVFVAAARAAGNPGTQPAGPPAEDAYGVLADLFRSADARAGVLAKAFDEAHTAGQTCEREYDTLTAGRSP